MTETSLKRYKYVGKERDEETGLYYYGARYYAAWLCRFVSVDPLQHKYPHYTPYQYAGNKPISYIDLDGLEEAKKDNEAITTLQPKTVNQISLDKKFDVAKRNNSYIDYYNMSGNWIGVGWGNVDQGNKRMALSDDIIRKIQNQTSRGNMVKLTNDESYNTPPVYSDIEIAAMDDTYTRSESSHLEEGFAAGILNNKVVTANANSSLAGKIAIGTAYVNLGRLGVAQKNMLYDTHIHPALIMQISKDKFKLSDYNPSDENKEDSDLSKPDYGQPKIVLGYDIKSNFSSISEEEKLSAASKEGQFVPVDPDNFPKMISFYKQNQPISSMLYSKFKNAVSKINEHIPLNEKSRGRVLWH